MRPLSKEAKRFVAMKVIAGWNLGYYHKHHWMELSSLSVGKSTAWLRELEELAERIAHETTE